MRVLAALMAVGLLAGCGATESSEPSDASVAAVRIYGAKTQVKAMMRDPKSVQFRGLTVHKAGEIVAVCGQVNGANGLGGMGGFQRFVSDGASVTAIEEQLKPGEMDQLWAALCLGPPLGQ